MNVGAPGPVWSPLGNDSGACAGFGVAQACGYTGWVEVEYVFDIEASFTLQFGAVNMEFLLEPNAPRGQFQSGIAFDSIEFIPAQEQTFLVEAFAESGGTVDPGSRLVDAGETATFTVVPPTGFIRLDAVDGSCPTGSWTGNNYTTGPINSDCMVSFSFEQISW